MPKRTVYIKCAGCGRMFEMRDESDEWWDHDGQICAECAIRRRLEYGLRNERLLAEKKAITK